MIIEFLNVLCAIFDMAILMVYLNVILDKRSRRVNNYVYFTGFVLVFGIIFTVNELSGTWPVNIAVSLLSTFALSFFYNGKIVTSLFGSISYQVFAMLAELFSYGLIMITGHSGGELPTGYAEFYVLLVSKLILFIITAVVSLIIKKNSKIVNLKDYLCLIVTPIVSLATIIPITFEVESGVVNTGPTICLIVAGIMIINIIVYYLMESITETAEIKEKQARMEIQFAHQEQKYEQTSLSFKKISSILHDTNKHLLYLRECFEQNEKTEAIAYIDKALENIEKSYKRINSGHLVIDALVSNALNTAYLSNISFKSDIRIDKDKINIERYDLSVTLGNLLDNSVEACKKVPALEDRYINISIITTETALVIDIINSKNRNNGNGIKTDKPDKLQHGLGLSNVAAIAEKYGGTLSVTDNESVFEAAVVLPLR
jgi:signal transduction histidine kinase